jgi:DNA uptake protein ComE-like DNA-binding protein
MTHLGRQLSSLLPLLALAGCAVEEPATSTVTGEVKTIDDTDLATECQGILGYINWAPYAELDYYLPVNLANAILARRAVRPFVDLADISSVSGIAQARLAQITGRAYTLDFIDADCSGVYEEIAVSHDDRAAILAYVNTASSAALEDVVRADKHTVVPAIIAARPFTSLQPLVDIPGIATSTFRALRDAAIVSPFDALANRVNAAHVDVTVRTDFDWFATLYEQPGYPTHLTCFGISASIINELGGALRPNLADGAEVLAEATNAISYANRYGGVGDATAGLAHLAAQVGGETFFGCYLNFAPDPWSGINRAFFVNTVTGYRVFTEIRWSE